MVGEALKRGPRLLLPLLLALGAPGLFLLARDALRPSPARIVERAARWRSLVREAASRFRVDADLVLAVVAVESKGDPAARGESGEIGLMQVLPVTAAEEARRRGLPVPTEEGLGDPATNIFLGTAYLSRQLARFEDDPRPALAAYNAGAARVARWISENPGLSPGEALDRAAFPTVRAYVRQVLAMRDLIRSRRERSSAR